MQLHFFVEKEDSHISIEKNTLYFAVKKATAAASRKKINKIKVYNTVLDAKCQEL